MNRKGFMQQIMIVLIFVIVLAAIMSIYYLWSLSAPIYESLQTDVFHDLIVATNNETPSNLSESATTAFNVGIDSLAVMESISVIIFFFLIIGFIAMCAFVRTYPFLMVVWIVGIILLVFFSLILTSTYEDMKQDSVLRGYYTEWGMNDFILSNMPILILVVGVVGGLIMMFVLARDPDIDQGVAI